MQVCRFGPASAGIIKHDMLSSPADKTIKILFVVRRELFYFIGNEVSYEIKKNLPEALLIPVNSHHQISYRLQSKASPPNITEVCIPLNFYWFSYPGNP